MFNQLPVRVDDIESLTLGCKKNNNILSLDIAIGPNKLTN